MKNKPLCKHEWNGEVNTRQLDGHEVPWPTHITKEEYVVCKKCAEVKVIREYKVRIGT